MRILGREITLVDPLETAPAKPNQPGRLILEKIPLLGLVIISCFLTIWAQQDAIAPLSRLPFEHRALNAVLAYALYIGKMLWPSKLALYYPLKLVLPIFPLILAAMVIGGTSILVIVHAARRPYLFTGWFWFLGALVPVIGLVQVGCQALADRYTYVPLTGLFIIIAWGGYELTTRWSRPMVPATLAVLAVLSCIPLTRMQLTHWKNNVELLGHAVRSTTDNYEMEVSLGATYLELGQYEDALPHLARAANILPASAEAHGELGYALARLNRNNEAISEYRTALLHDPQSVPVNFRLGSQLVTEGNLSEGITHLTIAREYASDPLVQRSVNIALGLAFLKQGHPEEALSPLQTAAQIDPTNALLHFHLGEALNQSDRISEAAREYHCSIELDPKNPVALNNLAWILASSPDDSIRNGNEAVRLAEEACALTEHRETVLVGTLGAAYAEAGRFDDAVGAAREAQAMAIKAGQTNLAARNLELERLYQSGRPFHQPAHPVINSPSE